MSVEKEKGKTQMLSVVETLSVIVFSRSLSAVETTGKRITNNEYRIQK